MIVALVENSPGFIGAVIMSDIRHSITFEQAEGIDALPTQLSRNEISPSLKSKLWLAFYQYADETASRGYGKYISGRMRNAMTSFYVERHGMFAEDVDFEFHVGMPKLRKYFEDKNYAIVLGVVEFLVRRLQETNVPAMVQRSLIQERAAYRLLDGKSLVPLASEEEGKALLMSLSKLSEHGLAGGRTHLKAAANAASLGNYADSVRESMQAIESAARTITGTSKFSDALTSIEQKRVMHPAFKKGLLALYGYSSDEKGIRHPLLENGDAAVTEDDAILMLGICSSAITFMLARQPK